MIHDQNNVNLYFVYNVKLSSLYVTLYSLLYTILRIIYTVMYLIRHS